VRQPAPTNGLHRRCRLDQAWAETPGRYIFANDQRQTIFQREETDARRNGRDRRARVSGCGGRSKLCDIREEHTSNMGVARENLDCGLVSS